MNRNRLVIAAIVTRPAGPPAAAHRPAPSFHNLGKGSPATVVWLHDNFEPCETSSLNRNALYTVCMHFSVGRN